MLRTVDRYLFRQTAWRYAATVAVILALLMLENAHRLAGDLVETTAPLRLLGRLSLMLAPEHFAIANPVALFLAVALTARALTLRGEWQIFAAGGMSPARTLLAPMLLATLAAGLQLADRLDWRPGGERRLDALYREIARGEHGTPIRTREPLPLAPGTTMMAEGATRRGGTIVLDQVVVHRGSDILYAPRAAVLSGTEGGIVLDLQGGVAMQAAGVGRWRRVSFGHFHVGGTLPGLGVLAGNARQRFDRLGVADLWGAIGSGADGDRARAALVARVEGALFLLLLPWLGLALGTPPLRRHGAAGLAVGIALIVAHGQLAAAIEDHLAGVAVAAGIVHLLLWAGVVAASGRALALGGQAFARARTLSRVMPTARRDRPAVAPVSGQRGEAEADQILQPYRERRHAAADLGHGLGDRGLVPA